MFEDKFSRHFKVKNFIHLLFLIVSRYIFGANQERKLIFRVFFLLLMSHLFCFLVHSVTHGLLKKITADLYQGNGEIYFQFKKKLFLSEFKHKNIIERIKQNKSIKSFFAYGQAEGVLLVENDYVPILALLFLFDLEDTFFSYKKFFLDEYKKNFVYLGSALFRKYEGLLKTMKLLIVNDHNEQEKIFSYDVMSIKNIEEMRFNWDEWNNKALILDVQRFENYFEMSTIFALNIYLEACVSIKEVCEFLKEEFKEEVGYVSSAEDIFPEYSKYIKMINCISFFIIFLILLFSLFVLSLLIEMYLLKNQNQYLALRLIGISKKTLLLTVILLFVLVNGITLISSSVLFFVIKKFLNTSNLFLIDNDARLLFEISLPFYFFYSVCSVFLASFFSSYFGSKII